MSDKRFIVSATEQMEGAGARVKRLFPGPILRHFDPFVLLDEFFVDSKAGFPSHPHRGFEAITYMLEGSFHHKDNLGNDTTVQRAGAQRFTAGRGLIHSEMPASDGINHGFQLWINLPKRLKQIEPDYQQVNSEEFPETWDNGTFIRTIVGEGSPVKLNTPVLYQDITMGEGRNFSVRLASNLNGFIYLFEGQLEGESLYLQPGEALFLSPNDQLFVKGIAQSRFIFFAGQPHNEPINQWGSYVD